MNDYNLFKPNYAVPPAETFQELLHERGISLHAFAEQTNVPYEKLCAFVERNAPIDENLASSLEKMFTIPMSFWLNLEKNYQATIVRLKQEKTNKKE